MSFCLSQHFLKPEFNPLQSHLSHLSPGFNLYLGNRDSFKGGHYKRPQHVVMCACHHPLTPHKDFSTLLIQCQGPSHPHQLLLPLNPLGPATALKGEVKKRSFFSSLAPGPSPPSLAWPSTRVVSIDLPSGDQLHSRLHLPPSFDAGQQTPLLLHFPSAVREEVRTLQHVHQFIWMGFVFLDRGRLHASKENDGRLENGRNRLKVEVPPGSEFVSDSRW